MSANLERELKLNAPQGFSLARLPRELKSFVAAPAQFQRLHTVYYDSEDLRLMRWGCSLRHRRGEGWTLKIPASTEEAALQRTEHVFHGTEDRPPAAALDLATAYLRGAPVKRIAELRTVRVKREFLNAHGDDLAEVVEDDVRVVDGTKVAKRFTQIEIELAQGVDGNVAGAIADVLSAEGAGGLEQRPKNAIAATDREIQPEITIPDVSEDSPLRDALRAAIAKSVIQLVRTDAQLRLSDDAEAVHRARVAVRRLRSDLRTFLPILDEAWACALRERLSRLQDRLSPVRDADVLAASLERLAENLPPRDARHASSVIEELRAARKGAHEALRAALRAPHYSMLLQDLVRAATRPQTRASADERAGKAAFAFIKRAYKKIRKAVRRAGTPPSDRELHRIRIKAKHLRYGAEALTAACGATAKEIARAAERLQTVLGEQHDGVVIASRLRETNSGREETFAAGELAVLALQQSGAARAKWPRLWKKLVKLIN